jgi:hypothetical protein
MTTPMIEDAREHLEPGSFKPVKKKAPEKAVEEAAEGPSGLFTAKEPADPFRAARQFERALLEVDPEFRV